MKRKVIVSIVLLAIFYISFFVIKDEFLNDKKGEIPFLKMPDNNLTFNLIEDYDTYKIVASHFRTDKNEIRYILANSIAYKSMKEKITPFPEGSIIVKIGWTIKNMESYPVALEADKLERIEYMLKDSKKFNANGDNWGYARFVKKDGNFTVWNKGINSCITCHSSVKNSDYVFTKFQYKL